MLWISIIQQVIVIIPTNWHVTRPQKTVRHDQTFWPESLIDSNKVKYWITQSEIDFVVSITITISMAQWFSFAFIYTMQFWYHCGVYPAFSTNMRFKWCVCDKRARKNNFTLVEIHFYGVSRQEWAGYEASNVKSGQINISRNARE